MRKLEKCAAEINERFSSLLASAFKEKFGAEVKTTFNLFSMTLVSNRADGSDFTPEEHAWVAAFSDGYAAAMGVARDMSWQDLCKGEKQNG